MFLTLVLCARPIHFLFLSFAKCDRSGYDFVKVDKDRLLVNFRYKDYI